MIFKSVTEYALFIRTYFQWSYHISTLARFCNTLIAFSWISKCMAFVTWVKHNISHDVDLLQDLMGSLVCATPCHQDSHKSV